MDPRRLRRLRRALLSAYAATPVLVGLWAFHRAGLESGLGGAAGALIVSTFFMFDAARLLRWLAAPRASGLWRHDRIFWSASGLIAAGAMVGAIVLIGAFDPVEEHGPDGFGDGAVAGLVCAALVIWISARCHDWLVWLRGPRPAPHVDDPSRLQAELAPTLAELELVRLEAGRRIRRRAAWLTPIGAGAALALWAAYLAVTGDLNLIVPPVAIAFGALAGHVVAAQRLALEYEALFKTRVLPRLAGLFGALTYRRPPPPDLERLRRFHVFRRFDTAHADDSIAGRYRGLDLEIVQLRLTRGSFPVRRQVFRGLLVELTLNNRLTGTTAIAADAGALGNLLDQASGRDIRRVGLESRAFEREYEVYATDQVMARALLTPRFMERFTALGRNDGFGRPLALAEDDRLLIAMPFAAGRSAGADYFAPPGYDQPAQDDAVLTRLYRDLLCVLAVADEAIALDEATSRQAAPAPTAHKP
ncbi:MAG TPA: DUF3137 domain-containing protein [Caulobacteraceae bacterium]|nr:DUF3137 domain-containing protein [Caulobacteraceae bacterium]